MIRNVIILLNILILTNCAGTIKTTRQSQTTINTYKKAYIISAENSQYIKFKLGIITPFAYIIPADGPSQEHENIGNTDLVIKQELEKYGMNAIIGKEGEVPDDIDLIVLYQDVWRWDFKKILDRLDIIFISPIDQKEIAKSTYTIHQSKEFHNFPKPEKEVPKMIKELMKQ